MKYAFIQAHRPVFSIRAMCRGLRVHPSGFYAWLKSPFCKRAKEDKRQTKLLKEAWEESGKVYGYRKLHDDLRDQGETCCPNRVARLANLAGIKAQIGYKRRPGKYGGKPSVVVNNTLDRQFNVDAPDRFWVTDITYIKTYEGFSYLAVVIDLYSRRVVGWSMQNRQHTELVLQALLMAVWRRKPRNKVLIHSDQGSQFTSIDWAAFLKQHNLEHSMSGEETATIMLLQRAFSTYSNASALDEGCIEPETMPGRTCSIILKCSITRNVNTLKTGCCHLLILKGSKK